MKRKTQKRKRNCWNCCSRLHEKGRAEKERETKKITREMETEKFYGKKRMRKSRLDEEERGAEEG